MTTHRLHFLFFGFVTAVPVEGRTHRASVLVMQMANQQTGVVNSVDTAAQLLQAHALFDEGFADKSFATPPANLPIAADLSHLVARRVLEGRQCGRKAPPALAIKLGWCFLPQRLVRSQVVVAVKPDR